jgi:hypothetical protein
LKWPGMGPRFFGRIVNRSAKSTQTINSLTKSNNWIVI